MTRVTAVLARCSGTTTCSRCTDAVDVTAGHWHAADHAEAHRAICDTCTLRDDPQGHTTLLAWRRAANGPTTGTRNRS